MASLFGESGNTSRGEYFTVGFFKAGQAVTVAVRFVCTEGFSRLQIVLCTRAASCGTSCHVTAFALEHSFLRSLCCIYYCTAASSWSGDSWWSFFGIQARICAVLTGGFRTLAFSPNTFWRAALCSCTIATVLSCC